MRQFLIEMKPPSTCSECPMCYDYMQCNLADKEFDGIDCVELIANWCPLVSVPPHGRLIDADEFLKRAIGTKCFRGDYALMLEELVGESVTIIPADDPKEETE